MKGVKVSFYSSLVVLLCAFVITDCTRKKENAPAPVPEVANPEMLEDPTALLETLTKFSSPIVTNLKEESDVIQLGDFNEDGKSDLAAVHRRMDFNGSENGLSDDDLATAVSLYLGDGKGGFVEKAPMLLVGKTGNGTLRGRADMRTADLNQDGHLDLVAVSPISNDVVVWFGDGKAGFQKIFSQKDGIGPNRITVFLNPKTKSYEFAIVNGDTGTLVTYRVSQDKKKIEKGVTVSDLPDADEIASGDFNGDGLFDLGVASQDKKYVALAFCRSDGTYEVQKVATDSGPISLLTYDLNGDGSSELFYGTNQAGSNTESSGLHVIQGGKKSSKPSVQQLAQAAGFVTDIIMHDLNSDGVPDLLYSEGSSIRVGLNSKKKKGSFTFLIGTINDLDISSSLERLVQGDVNGDGMPDLVGTDDEGERISTYLTQK
jgi:hypothetical protein